MTERVSGSLANVLTSFFTRHLAVELGASSYTVTSYRDAFVLLLRHLVATTGRQTNQLTFEDLTPAAILTFLAYLEHERGNSIRTRNARLAAIRSFAGYVVTQDPGLAGPVSRLLAIPFKKTPGRTLDYLTASELRAILAGPDRTTPKGRRDYLSLALLSDTGARVQEVIDLRPADFRLDRIPLVRITGKGRKQRIVPLMPATAALVRGHLAETQRLVTDADRLIRNYRGEPMTRSGMTFLLKTYCRLAADHLPSLRNRRISPHTLRHTKAMHLLQAGVPAVTIKDILGHAHLKTLEYYVEADLEMKRRALETVSSPVSGSRPRRRHAPDLLEWLEHL
jgi:site-specific recombinase XerD